MLGSLLGRLAGSLVSKSKNDSDKFYNSRTQEIKRRLIVYENILNGKFDFTKKIWAYSGINCYDNLYEYITKYG